MTSEALRAWLVANGHTIGLNDTVDPRAAAAACEVHERTIRGWRALGRPPRALRLNGRYRYRVEDLAAFLTDGGG